MITISEVILIQDILIERYGGTRGIRDRGLLESAISRPFQTFDHFSLMFAKPILLWNVLFLYKIYSYEKDYNQDNNGR